VDEAETESEEDNEDVGDDYGGGYDDHGGGNNEDMDVHMVADLVRSAQGVLA
jgi:hypothetical protein